MDFFDKGAYFASCVPTKALNNQFLKHAVLAYTAKHLSRVKDNGMEHARCSYEGDWSLRADNFHHTAMSMLHSMLHDGKTSFGGIASGGWHRDNATIVGQENNQGAAANELIALSDELLPGLLIQSMAEFHDSCGLPWSHCQYLDGTKLLLDLAEMSLAPTEEAVEANLLKSRQLLESSRTRKALFWAFACQDFLTAFINECQTRLDTEDLILWQKAGLLLDEKGLIRPSKVAGFCFADDQDEMQDGMRANAVIWLASKLINFMAAGDGVYHQVPSLSQNGPALADPLIGVNQKTLLERWGEIEKELNIWLNGLPSTFSPCARVDGCQNTSDMNHFPPESFSQIWYSNSACGASSQTIP